VDKFNKKVISVRLTKRNELGEMDKKVVEVLLGSDENGLFNENIEKAYEILDRFETYDDKNDMYVSLLSYFSDYEIYRAGVDYENCEVYALVGRCYQDPDKCKLIQFTFEFECCH